MPRSEVGSQHGAVPKIAVGPDGVLSDEALTAYLREQLYVVSSPLGFISRQAAEHHLRTVIGQEREPLVQRVIREVALYPMLPHSYLYVEAKGPSQMVNSLLSTLAVLGDLEFEELYRSSQRYCSYRFRQASHPPRSVLLEFLKIDERFNVDVSDVVSRADPIEVRLGTVQEWMLKTIKEASGWVLHRNELFELARSAEINTNSVSVYCTNERFYKQIQGGYITLTGHTPLKEDVELARIRSRVVAVETVVRGISVSEGGQRVLVDLTVGSDLCNRGFWYPKGTLNALIGGTKFQLYAEGMEAGRSSYFGTTSSQWQTAMRLASASVGDHVCIDFNLVNQCAEVTKCEFDQ